MKTKEVSFSTIKENGYNLSARHYIEDTDNNADREYWVDSAYRKKIRQKLKKEGYQNTKTTNEIKAGGCRIKEEVWVNQWGYALVFLKAGNTCSINLYRHWGRKVENAGEYIRRIYTKRELEGLLIKLRAIVLCDLCDTVYRGAGRFLADCHSEGMRIKKLGGFRYEINGVHVEFKRAEFLSIAGARADILATDVEDREIEAYRPLVLAHSQFKEGKNVRTLKDLMGFLK